MKRLDHDVRSAPWFASTEDVLRALDSSVGTGLSHAEARRRLRAYGPNRLREIKRRSGWHILADQFASPIVALLAVAGVVAFAFGEVVEGVAIVAVLFINAASAT